MTSAVCAFHRGGQVLHQTPVGPWTQRDSGTGLGRGPGRGCEAGTNALTGWSGVEAAREPRREVLWARLKGISETKAFIKAMLLSPRWTWET